MSMLTHIDRARRLPYANANREIAPFLDRENFQHGIVPGHVEPGPQGETHPPPAAPVIAPAGLALSTPSVREVRLNGLVSQSDESMAKVISHDEVDNPIELCIDIFVT